MTEFRHLQPLCDADGLVLHASGPIIERSRS